MPPKRTAAKTVKEEVEVPKSAKIKKLEDEGSENISPTVNVSTRPKRNKKIEDKIENTVEEKTNEKPKPTKTKKKDEIKENSTTTTKTKSTRTTKKKEENGDTAEIEVEQSEPSKTKTLKKKVEIKEPKEKASTTTKPKASRAPRKKQENGDQPDKEETEGGAKGDSKPKPVKLLNQTETDWKKIVFSTNKKNSQKQTYNQKIMSWNVDGIRAWLKKDCLSILKHAQPDILCLQETKCNEDDLPDELKEIEGYKAYWCASEKSGYAGVAVLCKNEPIKVEYGIGVPEHDEEGRCITAEFDKYFVVCVYVPNAGRKLVTLPKRLEWNEKFKSFIAELNEKKPVILCGDMNVAHSEIDLANPKANKKNAGFTQEERDGMTDFLEDGYVDVFRKLYPDEKDIYTFWTYLAKARANNTGWRLDYFIVPNGFMENVCDIITHTEVFGSDHCPITLFVNVAE